MSEPVPPAPTPQFSRVHDAYGPGPFLAWLLAAYTVSYQLFITHRTHSRRQYWTTDKDLAMVIAYPVFAAAHLFYQFLHYPGAKDKIWGTDMYVEAYRTPTADLEYALAVRAAARVCTVGLAVNIGLLTVLGRKRWWVRVVGVASGWVFVVLIFASWDSGWGSFFVGNVFSVLWTAILMISLPFFLAIPAFMSYYLVKSAAKELPKSVRELPSFQKVEVKEALGFVGAMLCMAIFWIPFSGFIWAMCWGVVWLGLTMSLMPGTAHPVTEVFQAMALVLGIINMLFTWREIRGDKEQGEGLDLTKDLEMEDMRIGPVLTLGVANMVAPVSYLWRKRDPLDGRRIR